MSSLRFWLASLAIHKPLTSSSRRLLVSSQRHALRYSSRNFCCCVGPIKQNAFISDAKKFQAPSSIPKDFPFSVVLTRVWRRVVQKGDTVVDATCGNGFDTLEVLKLVADDSGKGCVYAMDIQKDAMVDTSSLLDDSIDQNQKQLVKLFHICHSKMEEAVPDNASVRLLAFNLGYLPGGDKELITRSETTLLALEAAKRILIPGGLISIVVYLGHPGEHFYYTGKNWKLLKLLLLHCLLRIGSAASSRC